MDASCDIDPRTDSRDPSSMPDHPHLTDLEQLLLLSVLRCGGDAYGARLQEDVDETVDRHVSLGSIHMTLARLEARGLATSRKSAPRARPGGKARRIYGVTAEGRAALEATRTAMARMWSGVPSEEAG